MKQKNDKDQSYEEPARKSRRKKIPVQEFGEKKSKRTRRQRQSSQQYALPQKIPLSDTKQITTYRSFERETSRTILQIPNILFKSASMSQTTDITVESNLIQIKIINRDQDSIFIESRLHNLEKNQEQEESKVFVVWGKACWVSSCEVTTKIIKQGMKIISNQWNEICKFKTSDVCSDIFLVLNIKEKIQCTSEYNGLINQGNTCYMNSYLQMLNHISQFRNLVFDGEVEDENKFPATLQILFYRLGNDQKSVSAEHLVKSFGWSKKQAQIQQDAQEFSCLFFEALEKKLQEVCHQSNHLNINQLFQGKLLHYIECTDVEYRSAKGERFFDIQLNITDNLANSLDEYVSEQILSGDNMYDTQIYGKQQAKKGVKIEVLPPILMIQLKRFAFSPVTYENEKIMSRFEYPKEINFSRWLLSGENQEYQLYAVLVHEGIKAESGHYYVYLNVEDQWFKFNDQDVTSVNQRTVFQYNFGGEIDTVQLDAREMEVKLKKNVSSSTAYMLVYVKKEQKEELLQRQTIFPDWLKERDILKMEEKQVQKAMKNYYHHVQILNWQDEILGKDANEIGLLSKERYNFEELGKISKNQKVNQWLKEYNSKDIGGYLHITCHDKTQYECVVNMQGKSMNFQELIRQAYNPIIMLLPIVIKSESFLLVVKLHMIEPEEDHFAFDCLLQVNKYIKNHELVTLLQEKYGNKDYNAKFYIEEKKELTRLRPSQNSIMAPQSIRNCMIIIIVEKVRKDVPEKDIYSTEKWYSREKNTVQLIMKSQDGKYEFTVTIDQYQTIQDLRNLIFEEKLADDENYASPENIVIKSKQKKTSKVFSEHGGLKTVKDLIKGCDKEKLVMFGPSNLKINERVSQMEVKLKYRFKDLQLSDPLNIIFSKQSSEENQFYHKILNHGQIKTYVEEEGGKDIRIMILTKDFYLITDIVNKDGYVVGKGPIMSVLQKQKGANLIVEALNYPESQEMCSVLVYHLSLTNDRIGKPRCLDFPKNIKLSKLREQILEILKDQSYEWEEKIYPMNPLKLEMYAYVKDIKRSIELVEQVEETSEKVQEKQEKKEEKTLEKSFPKAKVIKVMIRHYYLTKAYNPMKLMVE